MNKALKEIKKLDKKVKKDFSGDIPVPARVDLFLKWLPVVYVLMADVTGVKTKNKFYQKVLIITLSELILNIFVRSFKKSINRRRPDSFFKYNSFPSGHTATSFSGAVILHEEIKAHSPLPGLAAYCIAAATATLRLYKRKHWLSDVVAGAVIGIISARLAYRLSKELI